jgi:hypothetical protein
VNVPTTLAKTTPIVAPTSKPVAAAVVSSAPEKPVQMVQVDSKVTKTEEKKAAGSKEIKIDEAKLDDNDDLE